MNVSNFLVFATKTLLAEIQKDHIFVNVRQDILEMEYLTVQVQCVINNLKGYEIILSKNIQCLVCYG